MLKKTYDWIGTQVHTPYAVPLLALCSFRESIVFPPVAPMLILFCIENKRRAFFYASIATGFSVLGGIAAYYLGFGFWHAVGQKLVRFITTPETFEYLVHQYHKHETFAVLIGSFLPVPYKAIGLTAGFCKLPLVPFIVFSLIGRSLRYYLVAWVLFLWGPQVKLFIDRWFNHLVVLFLLLLGLGMMVIVNS